LLEAIQYCTSREREREKKVLFMKARSAFHIAGWVLVSFSWKTPRTNGDRTGRFFSTISVET
jgi:preprotein translocase subunit Sec63